MPFYTYKALNRQGRQVKGTIDAPSLADAKQRLRTRALMPIGLKLATGESLKTPFLGGLFERGVDTKDKIRFTNQLAVLLRSGVPLLHAIELLSEQFSGKLKRILVEIKDGLREGGSFADLLARYPRVFTSVYVQLVRAGEATGKLEAILTRLNDYLEKSEETKKRIKSALSYPIMLGGFSFAAIGFMLTFVVPKITSIFAQTGRELPGPTKVLIVLSDILVGHFNLVVFGILGAIVLFMYWKSTPAGKYALDTLKLNLPLASYFSKPKTVVEFTKTLGMLLDSGVNLSEALDIVCNIIDNKILVDTLKRAREKIIKEGNIATYLEQTGIFPPIASYMIRTGEQSGELAGMLLNVARDYEVELGDLTDSLVAKINPFMMLVMGGIVVFIIVAMFMPVLELGDIAGV